MRRRSLLWGLAALCLVAVAERAGAQNPLGAPTVGAITAQTTTLTVPWTAPSDDGGSAITSYDLRYIRTDSDESVDANWTVVPAVWVTGGGTLEYEITDLPDGVQFDVQLRAENAAGDIGDWSQSGSATTTDHGDQLTTATALSPGASVGGHIEPRDDEDLFRIVLSQASDLWLYTDGELDTVGELLDSGGGRISRDDQGFLLDAPDGFSIREELEAGTYYVRVSSYRAIEAGSYTLHARSVTDPGDTAATAASVTLGSLTPGRIDEVDTTLVDAAPDADYFRLVLPATAEIWVTAVGDFDSYGELLDAEEKVLARGDDGGVLGNQYGFLLRRELEAGTYYIRVTGFLGGDTGPYALFVRSVVEPGGTAATAQQVALGTPQTGRISSASDSDYFRLTLSEETYVFLYAVSFGGALPLRATVLDDRNASVSLTQVIPHARWAEVGRGEVGFSAWGRLEAGSYAVRIQGSGGGTGSYLFHPTVSSYDPALRFCTGLATSRSDPWYGCQWHLSDGGHFPGGSGEDINVESVWDGGNTGSGIHVVVVDDGLQLDHPDLSPNIVAARNRHYSGSSVRHPFDTHGTAVAGLIAASDNDIGVRGVAPDATISVHALIAHDVPLFDHLLDAMVRHLRETAVSNNSWGFPARGTPISSNSLWEATVERGVREGYGGRGIVYVWSAGNGHHEGSNANFDPLTNLYAVTAVCAVGYDDLRASYSEMGASLWICAPSLSGRPGLPGITTTAPVSRYQDGFGGTSASAPIVSGVVALMRAENSELSWRDVKLILAASARQNDAANGGWEQGALLYGSASERYTFNHEYGFGMVDASAAVALADGWTGVPPLRRSEALSGELGLAIPDAPATGSPSALSATLRLDSHVEFIEFVELELDLEHVWFRDLRIELVSPSGAVSVLSTPAETITGRSGSVDGSYRFGSARHLGEDASGSWTLRLTDTLHLDAGTLRSWRIRAYGHGERPGYADVDDIFPGPGSLTVSWKAPDEAGASAVTSYDLRYIRDDATDLADANWTEVAGAGSTTSLEHTVSGLDGEAEYRVQSRARNSHGPGAWSRPVVAKTGRATPDPPRSLAAAARDRALALSWRLPGYVGSGEPTSYDLRYVESADAVEADPPWITLPRAWTTPDGELRYVIRGLENGTSYDVQLLARNGSGESGWSGSARGTPSGLNGPAEFPATESGLRSIPENTPPGVAIGDPVSARDDEGDTRTYSLAAGGATFDIDSATGQLRTKAPLDRERTPSYSVTVSVHDGRAPDGTASTAADDTVRVTISVEDVDEPPLVSGSAARTVRENATAVSTYTARDPEGAATTFLWTLSGADAGAFAISQAGVLTFDPAPDFEAPTDGAPVNTYRVTVQATDEGATEPDARTGGLEVTVTVEDVDEPPEIRGAASHTIAESGPTLVGRYGAADPEGGAATWLGLSGADARHFTFDTLTGQLRFAETPDYDRETNGNHGPAYRVTLRASDEGNRVGALGVVITLTDVPEPPLIEGDTEIAVSEGHTGALGTYTRRDPERSPTNWGPAGGSEVLSGADAGAFTFDQATGRLSFRSPPDFEEGGGSYRVTLTANDGVLDGSLDVTVTVANLEEAGAVELGAQRGVINVPLQATLTDPDGVVSESWQWRRSAGRSGPWTDIDGAEASAYTPAGDDRGLYLRAGVSYEDGHGPGKSAGAVTEFTTANERGSNTAPVLPDAVDDIEVPENTPAGRSVGSPVRAIDGENDPLVYSLGGAPEFTIGRTTGQIRVASGATLDYEGGPRSHALTVTADDGFGGTDTVSVTILVTDVNEPPVPSGDARTLDEDTTVEFDVLANDADPESGVLSLAGALASRPTRGTAIVDAATNRITYTPRQNYHGADSFTYRVQDDGLPRLSATATVSLTILPVNDAPEFAAQALERTVAESAGEGADVGQPVAATDVEGDTLSYSLSGPDATSFEIDPDSGQITVGAGVAFDVSVRDTYAVIVTATDDGTPALPASVEVTITVTTRPPAIFIGGAGGGGGPSGPEPSDEDFEWTVERDIEELDPSHDTPSGAWSDGRTLWLLHNASGTGDAVYAYDLGSGERAEEREFALHESNRAPRGIWSDGATAWVSDSGQERLYAYDLETGERAPERELVLSRRNRDARGIWGGGGVVWVADGGKDALFCYDLESGELLAEYALAPGNDDPRGLWSDGTTVWVSNHDPKRLFAYRLPREPGGEDADAELSLERARDEDFTGLSRASNNSPRGLWSDGGVMYVADENDGRVYSYNMPDAQDARLLSLELAGVDIGEFSPLRSDYAAGSIPHGDIATLEATAAQEGASLAIEPADHDGDGANGYQLRLLPGLQITITVTSPDGSRERLYRLLLGDGEGEACLRGAVFPGFSLLLHGGGSLDELEACAGERHVTALYATDGGAFVPYIPGAPVVVNRGFLALYPGGIPRHTPLLAKSEGPASPDPGSGGAVGGEAAPAGECLREEAAPGFSLLLYEGGPLEELDACARALGATALYATGGGAFVPYILGAPGVVNRGFTERYADGLPAATPLLARVGGP